MSEPNYPNVFVHVSTEDGAEVEIKMKTYQNPIEIEWSEESALNVLRIKEALLELLVSFAPDEFRNVVYEWLIATSIERYHAESSLKNDDGGSVLWSEIKP